MSFIKKCPNGFRIGNLEFYKVVGPFIWFEYLKGACGCHILEVMGFGVTVLMNECYEKRDEE